MTTELERRNYISSSVMMMVSRYPVITVEIVFGVLVLVFDFVLKRKPTVPVQNLLQYRRYI